MIISPNIDKRLIIDNECCFIKDYKPIIIQEFNDEWFCHFRESINNLIKDGHNIIPIIIDSFGGDAYTIFGMIDIIENLQKAGKIIVTTSICKSMSAGALLLALGTKGYRFISPNSVILLHEVSNCNIGGKTTEINANAKEVNRINKLAYQKLAEKSGKNKDFFLNKIKELNNTEWFLSPKDVVKLGICDYIGLPNITVDVNVDIKVRR